MQIREQDKHFMWSLYAAISGIFIWKGLWEGLYEIPYIGDPWIFLFIGFAMLTFSGIIFKEFDPLGGVEKAIKNKLKTIGKHPERKHFKIKYHDKIQKKTLTINAENIKGSEKKSIIFEHSNGGEFFVPFHRIKEIIYKGKTYWRM